MLSLKRHLFPFCILTAITLLTFSDESQAANTDRIQTFTMQHCIDCHSGPDAQASLNLQSAERNLDDDTDFAVWERIFDRVRQHEMPPQDAEQPTDKDRSAFLAALNDELTTAHARRRGTVLRRLNRKEYENTINDLFGTHLSLGDLLPEDSRTHEFDNIGSGLGLSVVHLQQYMNAADKVLESAIVSTTERPAVDVISAGYAETREGEKFIGRVWKKLSDGAVVRFSGGGYPTGMLRGTSVGKRPGRYRVQVTGYAWQSDSPIEFSVGGTSFAPGAEKPIYGFWSFAPGKPGHAQSIEFETWIDENYMIAIEPWGIHDPQRYQRKSIDDYQGPGLAILNVTLTGPLLDDWPSRGHRLIFEGLDRREKLPANPTVRTKPWYRPVFEVVSTDERRDAALSLRRITRAAFRGRATDEDVDRYVSLFLQQRAEGESFEEALRTCVTAVLSAPKFIYLQEPDGPLDSHALACRLAYFLSRTAPDDELRRVAHSGALLTDDELHRQTERLLADPRFDRWIDDFTDSWLDLRDIDFTIPDGKLFPEYDSYLRYSMPLETRAYLKELIRANEPVAGLVQSDFAMLNSRLALHYELPPVEGSEVKRTSLPANSLRGGFLSQAAVLKVTANGTNTSPVARGAWVLERFLGIVPPPPPPGIPGVEPDIRGATTLREQLEKHRSVDTCNSCHQKIDPPGFALECFDPVGGFRTRYRSIGEGDKVRKTVNGRNVSYRLGPSVDNSGRLPDGRTFSDYRQFRAFIAQDSDVLARTLVTKLLTFATGREQGFSDRPQIERIVTEAARTGYRIRDIIHLVVQSRIFREK